MSFELEYKKLNRAQREAVDYINGPLLVIAGPGTGKTQLLSSRVANILKKTDIYPENILCLTFTNKAADNMSQRLLNLIGNDARAAKVKTFHGLAADIMNRYPEYFWRGARLSIAPGAIQLHAMQKILYNLPVDHPLTLKFAGQFTLISDVIDAVKLVKEAGLTPDKLRAIIAANMEYIFAVEPKLAPIGKLRVSKKTVGEIESIVDSLPGQEIEQFITPLLSLATIIKNSFRQAVAEAADSGKYTSVSKWKSRWLQPTDGKHTLFNERKHNDWWEAVADAYERYRKQLHKLGYYDYADMLVESISQIEQHEDLRAQLQEQFQYVLIDEFQDTNTAQLRLAHLIADHSELEQPNIMAVGDDDQSIFKFQGAELSNMLGFTTQYPKAKLIVLTENYRSSQNILDNAEKIISTANYRLVNRLPELTKNLKAVNPPHGKSMVAHMSFQSRVEQLNQLSSESAKLLKSGKSVAILARKHSSLREISMILHDRGVPITYEQSTDILELPAVQQLMIIIKTLVSVKNGRLSVTNELLSETLRHPMWQVDSSALWRFAIDQQTKYDWFGGLTSSKDTRLKKIGQWLDFLVGLSTHEPLAVVVEYVLGLRDNHIITSPLKTYYLTGDTDKTRLETLSAVHLLRALVSEFRAYGSSKIEDFVEFVDLMIQNKKVISDSSPFVSGPKSVELLTVHKAKGLEFDAVIVVDATHSEWSPGSRKRLPPANLPLRPAEDDADDYARLMYVAATRAKQTLLIGSYSLSYKGEEVMPAASLSILPIEVQKPLKGEQLIKVLEQALLWPKLVQSDEKAMLKPRLESFVLNVSNLINFLDVTRGGPAYFKERNLLRLPQAKTPPSSMGSAIHAALEEAQLLFSVNKFKFEKIVSKFEVKLLSEGLPEADYRKKLSEGRRILKHFLEKQSWSFNKGALPEYKVVEVYLDQAKLGGTLDILDNTGANSVISDYKTGRPLKSLNVKAGDEGIKVWKHKLQLVFYALLAELDPHIKVRGELLCQMVYVEADKKSELTRQYQPTRDELTRLGTLVQAVWRHVMKLSLPDTSTYSKDLAGIQKFENDLITGKA